MNAPQHFEPHHLIPAGGGTLELLPERVHLVHRLAGHFEDQVALKQRTELGPTAGFDLLNQHAKLVAAPLLFDHIEKRHVARSKLEILVAVFPHLALQARRAGQ